MKNTDIKNTLFTITLLAAIGSCFMLGLWQVDRYFQKQQLHDTPSESPVVEINQLIEADDIGPLVGSQLVVNGEVIPDSVFKLDNRMFEKKYGVDIFTLLRERSSGKLYPVNMGWLKVANEREKLKQDFDFSGLQTLQAKIARVPSKPPFVSDEHFRDDKQEDLWLFVNREHLEQQHGAQVEDLVLVNTLPTDGLIYREVVRENNAVMHILYAIQWFAFSLVGLYGLIKIYR